MVQNVTGILNGHQWFKKLQLTAFAEHVPYSASRWKPVWGSTGPNAAVGAIDGCASNCGCFTACSARSWLKYQGGYIPLQFYCTAMQHNATQKTFLKQNQSDCNPA